jgi:hypothetical protein
VTTPEAQTAARLTEIILALDAVATLYPARPSLLTAAEKTARAPSPDAVPPVAVSVDSSGINVTVRLGIHAGTPAPAAARQVAAAIRAQLGASAPDQNINVTVQICSISAPPAQAPPQTAVGRTAPRWRALLGWPRPQRDD